MVFTSQICVFHVRPTFSILCIIDVFLFVQYICMPVFYMYIIYIYIYIYYTYMYIDMDFHVCQLGEVFLAAAGVFFFRGKNDIPGIL